MIRGSETDFDNWRISGVSNRVFFNRDGRLSGLGLVDVATSPHVRPRPEAAIATAVVIATVASVDDDAISQIFVFEGTNVASSTKEVASGRWV